MVGTEQEEEFLDINSKGNKGGRELLGGIVRPPFSGALA